MSLHEPFDTSRQLGERAWMSDPLREFCPAKVNLFLAVTGKRSDGFHDLISLVFHVDFGDDLELELVDEDGFASLTCNDSSLACDASNLVLRMASAFRAATGWRQGIRLRLEKRIPTGAGLGGGSSDAAGALRLLQRASGIQLAPDRCTELAASIGSDVPLFLESGPCVMRGRGERVERLAPTSVQHLLGAPVLLYKPHFPVPTPWAYAQLAAGAPDTYLPAAQAEQAIRQLLVPDTFSIHHLYNSFERPVFHKFVSLAEMQDRMRRQFGAAVLMSGSGSCCLALGIPDERMAEAEGLVRGCWGTEAFVQRCVLRG